MRWSASLTANSGKTSRWAETISELYQKNGIFLIAVAGRSYEVCDARQEFQLQLSCRFERLHSVLSIPAHDQCYRPGQNQIQDLKDIIRRVSGQKEQEEKTTSRSNKT